MSERKPIASDLLRYSVSKTMLSVNVDMPPTDKALETDVVTRLSAQVALFGPAYEKMQKAKKSQTDSIKPLELPIQSLELGSKIMLDKLNYGISAGVITQSTRILYGLGQNQTTYPDFVTEKAKLEVANNIIKGETQRIADGGTAFGYPCSLADLQVILAVVDPLVSARNAAKMAFDLAQEDLGKLRPDMDAALDKAIKNLEYKFSEDNASSQRRKMKLYGVPYRNSPNDPFVELTANVSPLSTVSFADFEMTNSGIYVAKNTGSITLRLFRTDTLNAQPGADYLTIEPGKELSIAGIELGPGGKYFSVYNTSNAGEGSLALKRFLEE